MANVSDKIIPGGETVALFSGHRPRMARAAVALSQAVYQESRLSLREAEAARIRIAHINGCRLCKNFRLADDLADLIKRMQSTDLAANTDRGPPPTVAFYEAVNNWRASDLFSARERLAIEYAEHVAETPDDLAYDAAFWDRMHQHFDDGEIVDLTYSITTWIATGRFVHVLALDGVCPTSVPAPVQDVA